MADAAVRADAFARETLRAVRMRIDTHDEPVVYMRRDCYVCRSEGFHALGRVRVALGTRTVVATLNIVDSEVLAHDEAGLSEAAWKALAPSDGDTLAMSHPDPIESLAHVRAKVFGRRLDRDAIFAIVRDVVAGSYAPVHLAAFVTAAVEDRLDLDETTHLTEAMVETGERLDWGVPVVGDKHSVGGLPGNRTSPIVVAIAAANGVVVPKTSSRAITSPAGTADTMAVLTRVDLDPGEMRRVVERTGACLAWGGAVRLAPADDVFVRVERALDLDSEGLLVASVLSKKIAAGSTHVVVDMPVGPTAKVRTAEAARALSARLVEVARRAGMTVRVVTTDGAQPVGRGIGPALEARDVLAVLAGEPGAPRDLRDRALLLAAELLEATGKAAPGEGRRLAADTLESGRAREKFEAICRAQGGFRKPPAAPHVHEVRSPRPGKVAGLDNRRLARVAKLAGAPAAQAAGVEMRVRLGERVRAGDPLFAVHAESPGELAYALDWYATQDGIVHLDPSP